MFWFPLGMICGMLITAVVFSRYLYKYKLDLLLKASNGDLEEILNHVVRLRLEDKND